MDVIYGHDLGFVTRGWRVETVDGRSRPGESRDSILYSKGTPCFPMLSISIAPSLIKLVPT